MAFKHSLPVESPITQNPEGHSPTIKGQPLQSNNNWKVIQSPLERDEGTYIGPLRESPSPNPLIYKFD